MNLLAWVVEGTWPAVVDAVGDLAGPGDRVTLLHVVDPAVAGALHGAFAGLVGRGRRDRDPGTAVETAEADADRTLLAAAGERLGRSAQTLTRRGRTEREVVAACAGMDVLVVARDGSLDRVGPRSLGPATRFVVDHAPCAVQLVWPRPPAHTDPPPPPANTDPPPPPAHTGPPPPPPGHGGPPPPRPGHAGPPPPPPGHG